MRILEAVGLGTTVEEAKQDALNKLNVDEKLVKFEIVKQPEKKILGIFGGSEAEVKAIAQVSDVSEKLTELLRSILDKFNIKNLEIKSEQTEEYLQFNIYGENLGSVIGYHGETLDALQYIIGLVANKENGCFSRVRINVGDYREKRAKVLENRAKKTAEKVLKYKRSFSFEPMNSYERRVVHTVIQNIKGVKSWSEGERNLRHVIIGLDDYR